jgi:hypothetical protein
MVCHQPYGIIFCWALQQLDFVMAYPQAPIEMDIYMELLQGIQTKHGNSKEHVLKLEKNIYGQKQAGCMWNLFLEDKLMSIVFMTSLIDDCVFFCGDVIFMVGALVVACVTGFGSALTYTHMYDLPSNILHHTKCDGKCYHS